MEWKLLSKYRINGQHKYKSEYIYEMSTGHYWYFELEKHGLNVYLRLGLKAFECYDMNYAVTFTVILRTRDRVQTVITKSTVFSNWKLVSENYTLPLNFHSICDENKINLSFHECRYVPVSPTQLVDGNSFQFGTSRDNMRNFLSFLQSGELHDLVIIVDGVNIKCHRCILSWRSPYLRAMILSVHGRNALELTGFTHEIIKTVINFLYTWECPKLPVASSMSLLKAAEKYQIMDLRDVCVKNLISDINDENAIEVYLHADEYSATEIKKKALDFICANFTAFQDAKQYEPLMTRPDLFRELVLAKAKTG